MNRYVYALGYFDGVHLGHRELLHTAVRLAAEAGCQAGVVTFSTHPDALVFGRAPVLINTAEDRERLLRSIPGIERIAVLPFDEALRDTPWEDFLDTLRTERQAAGFVCGDDFRFGRRGRGSGDTLLSYCQRHGLPCAVVPQQSVDGVRISSTAIRQLLENGDTEEARRFLGHPHQLTGTVVPGKQLGRTLGIPTANLLLPPELVVPRFGVYACLVHTAEGVYPAVTNVGTRPTVSGVGITVEPWLLNFCGDLYGQEITLSFYRFLRPEQKFPSLDALKAEIQRNARQTLAYFATLPTDSL